MNEAAWRARWQSLAPREKWLVAATSALVVLVLGWLIAVRPALNVVRSAEEQHRALDGQLQQMRALQQQARTLQAQPKLNHEEALRQLETSLRQRLGTSARLTVAGDRATVTLAGTAPDALARWLPQARIDARALPGEARLARNTGGLWDGTLVLSLPSR